MTASADTEPFLKFFELVLAIYNQAIFCSTRDIHQGTYCANQQNKEPHWNHNLRFYHKSKDRSSFGVGATKAPALAALGRAGQDTKKCVFTYFP